MHRAEEAINVVRIGMSLQSEQALGHGLQMLFGFGNEELKDLIGHLTILRQRVRKRSSGKNRWNGLALAEGFVGGCISSGRGRKRKGVALFEGGRSEEHTSELQ